MNKTDEIIYEKKSFLIYEILLVNVVSKKGICKWVQIHGCDMTPMKSSNRRYDQISTSYISMEKQKVFFF